MTTTPLRNKNATNTATYYGSCITNINVHVPLEEQFSVVTTESNSRVAHMQQVEPVLRCNHSAAAEGQ